MKTNLYIIQSITNLHVGSGETNLGVVDNLVQRDHITSAPNINSSSLKGAIREHFRNFVQVDHVIDVEKIFGSEVKDKEKRVAGSCRFFDASLLSMPVRSDKVPYFMATCPLLLSNLERNAKLFGLNADILDEVKKLKAAGQLGHIIVFKSQHVGASIEDMEKVTEQSRSEVNVKTLKPLFGNAPLVVIPDDDFRILCNNEHLPIISRNYLENGLSKNLFFEQVLPRESRLFFLLMTPDDVDTAFLDGITSEIIQIGAGATIGEGYCKISLVNTKKLSV